MKFQLQLQLVAFLQLNYTKSNSCWGQNMTGVYARYTRWPDTAEQTTGRCRKQSQDRAAMVWAYVHPYSFLQYIYISSMHQIECSVQYMLVCQDHSSPSPLSHAAVLTTTTASLVALWIVTVIVFGVVTAVLSWQIFKLKQKGMLGHMDDIEVNVSTCSCQVLVLLFSFSVPTMQPLPLLPSPSSSSQRP